MMGKKWFQKIKIRFFLSSTADLLNKHWVWKTIVLFLPSIYIPIIVNYKGSNWGLTNDMGSFSVRGWVLTIVIYGGVLGVNILVNYKGKRDKERESDNIRELDRLKEEYDEKIGVYQANLGIYNVLLQVIGNVCDTKFDSILGYIDNSLTKGQFSKPFNETVYPDRQLKNIAKEMKKCLSEITETPFNNAT